MLLFLHAAVVEQERLDHAQGLRAAESELERLQDAVRPFISVCSLERVHQLCLLTAVPVESSTDLCADAPGPPKAAAALPKNHT